MSIAQLKTLEEQIDSGNITSNEAKILEHFILLEKRGESDILPNLHQKFYMSKSTIVARLSSLEDMGVIYKTGEVKETQDSIQRKKYYSFYKYEPDPLKQETNRINIEREKFLKWCNAGLNKFDNFITQELREELIYHRKISSKI